MTAHSQRAHAKLSPSGGSRWFACPGSPEAEAPYPNKSGIHADEGTAAHTLAEHCLENSVDAAEFLGGHVNIKTGKVSKEPGEGKNIFTINEEMVDGVQTYVDLVRSLIEPGDEYEFEAKLDLTHIPGLEFGTGDFVRYRPSTRSLAVADLKYGKGVVVQAKRNKQLLIYATGTAKRYHNRGLDKVEMYIVQPRAPQPGDSPPGVRKAVIDAVELVEFRFELTEAAAATMASDAPRVAGDHCRWCRAAADCPTLREFSLKAAEVEFADGEAMPKEPVAVSTLSPGQLAVVLEQASVIEDWIKRVKERAHAMATEQGLPGFKFVRSTSHRKFKDEAAAARFITRILEIDEADAYTEPKLKSPAAIEKLLGAKRKSEIKDLIYKPPGKIILVPESDPREPVKPDAEVEFE